VGAFILLKVGQDRRESARQAEIRIATLRKILQISPSGAGKLRKKPVMVVSTAISPGYG
jgi:hypothetical protein